MNPFTTHTGLLASLPRANVDTDAIIPKQFLKSIHRTGFGPQAFYDWRYLEDGSPDPAFELNAARYENRSILVAGNNFGCGSSREHAVWALAQDGFQAIIAPWRMVNGERIPGFADIFCNNAVKNGVLTVELSESQVDDIHHAIVENVGLTATVDLINQEVIVHLPEEKRPKEIRYGFDIDKGNKEQLVNGLDDIDLTLKHESLIDQFEQKHLVYLP